MLKFWDIVAFFNWAYTLPVKVVCKALAPIAVLFVDRVNHPIWGINDQEAPIPYREAANPFRNACHNLFLKDQWGYDTWSNTDDWTLELREGFQWRFRRSHGAGNYISFRCTWGKPRAAKGKHELYVGWTMNEEPTMRPTLQLR